MKNKKKKHGPYAKKVKNGMVISFYKIQNVPLVVEPTDYISAMNRLEPVNGNKSDSFLLQKSEYPKASVKAAYMKKHNGKQFIFKTEEHGVRCWRLK